MATRKFSADDMKHDTENIEYAGDLKQVDSAHAADAATETIVVTEEDDRRIRKAIDRNILPILIWVYWLQILDKSLLGYASVFGLQTDAKLKGTQYSFIGSAAPIAQICWLPFSSYLIVRVKSRPLMAVLVLGWGAACIGMGFSKSYGTLVATRFILGLFEAAVLPLFSIITSQWYRRSEQPLRVAMWYGTNGLATILGSAGSYALGHAKPKGLYSWQLIFLVAGCLTVVTPVWIWFKLDSDIAHARFLSPEDRLKAVERVKSNKTGVGSNQYRWGQVLEAFLEPKTWLWIAMSLAVNVGASVTNVFGPLIISGLGFDKYHTSLLNIPFGAMQLIAIVASSYAAYKFRIKSAILAACMVPVVVGLVMLYTLKRDNSAPLLVAYYFLALIFAANPLLVSWIMSNTAGTTKKSITMMNYNIGSSAGNIIGPLLFNAKDKPTYKPGLKAVMGIFIGLMVMIGIQAVNLAILNKMKAKERVSRGMSATVVDHSMDDKFTTVRPEGMEEGTEVETEGDSEAALDMTDKKQLTFLYVL
ncbi:hypothetical protein QFC21_000672 [Naganishia friedmannii]|uniref:Uncharacterized protein n=1 Tax=Naganishia friedmannii TaxID=89922 RepID=A0ACC2WC75_9TREE|nr:hypothetical protein QFC21_000672 [Naganishia friedmannii]